MASAPLPAVCRKHDFFATSENGAQNIGGIFIVLWNETVKIRASWMFCRSSLFSADLMFPH